MAEIQKGDWVKFVYSESREQTQFPGSYGIVRDIGERFYSVEFLAFAVDDVSDIPRGNLDTVTPLEMLRIVKYLKQNPR
jgi:hypothetical protein